MADLDETEPTQLLQQWREEGSGLEERVLQLLYPRLRRTAAGLLAGKREVSLSPGDLVHETVLRLLKGDSKHRLGRAQYLALASTAMRYVLIDHVRAKQANKRFHYRVTLITNLPRQPSADLRSLNHALLRLAAIDKVMGRIVEMRYFGGMSIADIAEVTELSKATVKRRWTAARAWLLDVLEQEL